MAEAQISALLELLSSRAVRELILLASVEKKNSNQPIIRNLEAIQAVLEDAEERQMKDLRVQDWLNEVKEVCYEIEDVHSDWRNNEFVKRQLEEQEKDGENALATKMKKKVCFSISAYRVRRRFVKKIKYLDEKLARLANQIPVLNLQPTKRGMEEFKQADHEQTVSFSWNFPSMIFGRENERDDLVRKLVRRSCNNQERRDPLLCIPIVGMAGIGKTTLAQLVFNDEIVERHFDKRVWIHVSKTFDEIKIAKAILERLNINDTPISNDLQTLLSCICKSIEGKRFLLVLDDVWNENQNKWEPFKLALQSGATASRILVTTQKQQVAVMMGATTHNNVLHLKGLTEKDCWSLFCRYAFSGTDRDPSLEKMGKEIIKRCEGLPLAVKALGGMMYKKKSKEEWQDVLNTTFSWNLEVAWELVFPNLLRSYYDLAPPIKRCLLYCATFPKGFTFSKDLLIEVWMSQNYLIRPFHGEEGQTYFENLVMRSFFQEFVEDDDENITSYKIHDVMHDLLQYLTRTECFVMEKGSELSPSADAKIRHLTIMFAQEGDSFPPPLSLIQTAILKMKYLRTLNLSHNKIKELPKEIGELVCLRYIDMSHNYCLKQLPNTLCKLYNLQTLHLVWCRGLRKLPEGMGKLVNLRHLHVKNCEKLKYLPKEIRTMSHLRVLDEIVCAGGGGDESDDNEAFTLRDLCWLDGLQGSLSIKKLGNVKDGDEAKEAQLIGERNVLILELDFENEEDKRRSSDAETLDALEPPPTLEFLRIGCYDGISEPPRWMTSLRNLTTLVLEEWKYCESLPPLGDLRSLAKLEISGMHSLKKVGAEFFGRDPLCFPKLKELRFRIMQGWSEWEEPEQRILEEQAITIMPCLSSLRINSCSLLNTLPDFLIKTPLQELRLEWCPTLARACQKDTGKEWPKISHVRKITIDGKIVQADGVWIEEINPVV